MWLNYFLYELDLLRDNIWSVPIFYNLNERVISFHESNDPDHTFCEVRLDGMSMNFFPRFFEIYKLNDKCRLKPLLDRIKEIIDNKDKEVSVYRDEKYVLVEDEKGRFFKAPLVDEMTIGEFKRID